MKTAMKKLLSFVLVAMLLVSAIPFQASALAGDGFTVNLLIKDDKDVTLFENAAIEEAAGSAFTVQNYLDYYLSDWADSYENPVFWTKADEYVEADHTITESARVVIKLTPKEETKPAEVAPIKIVVKVDTSDNVVWTGEKVPANDEYALVKNLLSYCWNSSWDDVYEFDHAWSHVQGQNVALDGKIYAGDTVYIMVNKAASSSASGSESNSSITNKFPYNVYLHIYKDNKIDEPDRSVNITNGIALDGKVTMDEVASVVKSYYSAKTSDGIGYDGMYMAKGNWAGNFVNDTQKYTTIEDTNEMRKESRVDIIVMITNATAKTTTSTSTADSTNPKTGDSVYMVMSVMGLSAAALAAVYYVSKKRAF